MMNITVVLIKNTAALDFVLPVLWGLRQRYPDANLNILYCRKHREELLGGASFYSDVLRELSIAEYDFSNNFDKQKYKRKIPSMISYSRAFKIYKKICSFFQVKPSQNGRKILETIKPDLILLDNTSSQIKKSVHDIYEYLEEKRIPVILLPHAPHHSSATEFSPFCEQNKLPDFVHCWMPFIFDRYYESDVEKKDQFHYVGYPGMDLSWFNFVALENCKRVKPDIVTCMFVIRRFLDKGQDRSEGDNQFVYDYEQMTSFVEGVSRSLNSLKLDYKLIVKPHPSNNRQSIEDFFSRFEIDNWEVSCEPIYHYIGEIDFVISIYSTAFLTPAIYGVPVILIQTSTQVYIHKWLEIKEMYTGLRFYVNRAKDISRVLPQVIDEFIESHRAQCQNNPDSLHLRKYYPDGAIERAIGNIEFILGFSR